MRLYHKTTSDAATTVAALGQLYINANSPTVSPSDIKHIFLDWVSPGFQQNRQNLFTNDIFI
jgi:hypothetical protein